MTEDHFDIPIGTQVLQVSDDIRAHLPDIIAGRTDLIGSRVWVEQRGEEFFLHVGDLSVGD
jgi:hypothetical protein